MSRNTCANALLVSAILTLVAACPPSLTTIVPEGKLVVDGPNPECPHDYSRSRETLASLPEYHTGIPEFNDCQKLITRTVTGERAYGPLAAVFARDGAITRVEDTFARPTVVALVYKADEPNYPPLRLESTYGCLVLWRVNGSLTGWIVPREQPQACDLPIPTDQLRNERRLTVRVLEPPKGLTASDIPVVARWDWDETTGTQFIGVRCGQNWCEVGQQAGFDSSDQYDDPSLPSPHPRRNLAIKGWYDEQSLAQYPTVGRIEPMKGIGTLFPSADLASMTRPSVTGHWVEVARVHMRPGAGPYEETFNFAGSSAQASASARTRISLCAGSAITCRPTDPKAILDPTACTPDDAGDRWYARVDHPTRAPRYFCVLYRKHPAGFSVPAVVRWRWRANDETIWISCPAGCCEVNARRS